MNVGFPEIAVLLVTVVAVGLAMLRTSRPWLFGVIAMAGVAMLVSPPDIASMLLIAVPCSAIYCVALFRMEKRLQPEPGTAG